MKAYKYFSPFLFLCAILIIVSIISPDLFSDKVMAAGSSSGVVPAPDPDPVPPAPEPEPTPPTPPPTIETKTKPQETQPQPAPVVKSSVQQRRNEARVRNAAKLERVEFHVAQSTFENFIQKQSFRNIQIWNKLQAEIKIRREARKSRFARFRKKKNRHRVYVSKKKK